MTTAKLYPPQDPIKLGAHYTRHIAAMTTEELHSKADIAEQLAWRDLEIEHLRLAVNWENDCSEQYRMSLEQVTCQWRTAQAAALTRLLQMMSPGVGIHFRRRGGRWWNPAQYHRGRRLLQHWIAKFKREAAEVL